MSRNDVLHVKIDVPLPRENAQGMIEQDLWPITSGTVSGDISPLRTPRHNLLAQMDTRARGSDRLVYFSSDPGPEIGSGFDHVNITQLSTEIGKPNKVRRYLSLTGLRLRTIPGPGARILCSNSLSLITPAP